MQEKCKKIVSNWLEFTKGMTMSTYPFSSNFFSLQYKVYSRRIKLTFIVNPEFTTTRTLVHTRDFLSAHCPHVLDTTCSNYDNLPFREEVKNTELGHLFEHMLLSYMREEKQKAGHENFCISGTTNWNWKKQMRGIFHIKIDTEAIDEKMFALALHTTCHQLEKLFLVHRTTADSWSSQPSALLSTSA